MTDFVGSYNDTAETAGILDDGNTVHLLQPLVDHAGASDVCKALLSFVLRPSVRGRNVIVTGYFSDQFEGVCTEGGFCRPEEVRFHGSNTYSSQFTNNLILTGAGRSV